jgi:hypothetical protein
MSMVRLPIVLLVSLIAAPAAGQTAAGADAWRVREVTVRNAERHLPSIDVGSNARFGLGVFGLKSQTPRSKAVIGHELSAPKQRRAGVGFSVKF